MKQKLIAIDLDGTTLNSESKLSPKTIQVLKQAGKEGHIVSIVTGRPNRISENFYDELALKSPMINFNGALAYIPHQKWNLEYQHTVNRDLAFDILRMKNKYGINMVAAEGKNMLLADNLLEVQSAFFPNSLTRHQILNAQNLTTDPTSVTLFVERKDQENIEREISTQYPEVDVRTWGGPNAVLEVVAKGIQKAKGVAYLADYYNIDQADIVAFGDESNDNEMIDYAGWGVAMANATPTLKKIANDVTHYSNADDGMANYLAHYLKLNI